MVSLRSAAVGLRKRTQRQLPAASPATPSSTSASSTGVSSTSASLTLRDEKIIVMLAVQVQQINDRLTRLEDRFEASERESMSMAMPDQQDLLELRIHSARLAAELSRVATELRAEMNELAQSRGEVIDLTVIDDADPGNDAPPTHPSAGTLPFRRVDDRLLDVREPVPPRARPRRTSGWKPVRSSTPPDTDR